jgi:hypothetical protein
MKRAALPVILCAFLAAGAAAPSQAPQNGKPQIHFMDIGQGDGAILISPLGSSTIRTVGVPRNSSLDLDRILNT